VLTEAMEKCMPGLGGKAVGRELLGNPKHG
jgi:hypothetical protein